METLRSNKTFWLFAAGICLVAVAVAVGLKKMSNVVPVGQCSEVYKQYCNVEGVRATYIQDFRVNDTLTVGVTLLEATTDSGWIMLQEGFGLPVTPKEYEELFCGDSNKVTIKSFHKSVPLYVDEDTLANDLIAISYYKHIITHFVIQSKEQWKLIIHKQCDDNTKNDYLKYSNHEENN